MAKRNEAPEDARIRELGGRPVRLTSDMSLPKLSAVEIGSYALALFGMWVVLHFKLLGALLGGMLVYQLVHTLAPGIERHMSGQRARWVAVVVIAASRVSRSASSSTSSTRCRTFRICCRRSCRSSIRRAYAYPSGSRRCCPATFPK